MSTSSISRDDIFSAVVEAVCSIGKGRIERDGITPESRFNDIGIDSFGVMTLLVTLEGQLKIDLSALGQMEVKLMTVDDAVGLIETAASQ
jgi:acyl carrier protein